VSEQYCTDTAQSARLGCRRRLLQARRTDISATPTLVGGAHPIFVVWRNRENHQTDACHGAAAIARCDDEGEAPASFADKNGAQSIEEWALPSGESGPPSLKVDRTFLEG
jgi:hypothetical protein